ERKTRDSLETVLFSRREAVIRIGLRTDFDCPSTFEAVERGHDLWFHAGWRQDQCRSRYFDTESPTIFPPRKVCACSPGGGLIRALIRTFSGVCQMNLRCEHDANEHAD